ncbi:MAG: HEAT repeat domain-containing protein [Deltaproteobacteria bacterium]|nr:HEAT repeat domain-containing protein [Deltaproteobacteria bacterium]
MTSDREQLYVWINALDADDAVRRAASERALVASDPEVRPLLRKAIALAERPLVAARAALLLSRLRDRSATPLLLDALTAHDNDDVRAVLLRAVAELVEPAGADATTRARLVDLARDHDPDVRSWANTALDRLGAKRDPEAAADAAPAPGGDLAVEVGAADLASFARLAQDAADADVRAAVRQLATGNRSARLRAAQVLIGAGARGQRALINALAEPSLAIRTAAVQQLLQQPTPDASGALLMVAAGGGDGPAEANLRALALRALAVCLTGSEQHIVDDLSELCADPDRFARAAAAAALARLPFADSARALSRLLDDGDPFVVEEAARGLGRIGIPAECFDAAVSALGRPVARAHAPLLRGFAGMLAGDTLDDADRRARLRHLARGQLSSGDGERITAALALLDRLLHHPPIERAEIDLLAALLAARDTDVVRAALAVLATHATPEMTAVASALDRVDAGAGAGVDTLIAAVRARLAMR